MSQGRLYFILFLRPYWDLSIRAMYLFADIIQGKFLREKQIIWDSSVKRWKSHWKPLYMVIKHSVMQTLLPIWRFLFVALHKFTFSGESRSALLWILINWKPKKCHLMAILWRSFLSISHILQKFIIHEYKVCFPWVHLILIYHMKVCTKWQQTICYTH